MGLCISHGIGIPFQKSSQSWSQYWETLISATVENAAPTNVILTFPSGKPSLLASDLSCTVNGVARTINSASWTDAVWTVVLASAVVYGDAIVMTFVKSGGTVNVTNNVAAEGELVTYITGLTTPLSRSERRRTNELIKAIKTRLSATNLSDVADVIYILAGETAEQQLKNLVKNTHHATGATPLYSFPGRGRKGDKSTLYLNTNYNPSTQGSAYKQDDGSAGVYSRAYKVSNGVEMGGRNGTTNFTIVQPYSTNTFIVRINSAGASYLSAAFNNVDKLLLVNRKDANNISYFRNKVKTSGASVSSAKTDVNLYVGAWNTNGVAANFGDRLLAFVWIGRGLSDTEEGALQDAFDAYLIDNGNGVEESLGGILSAASHCWFTRQKALYNSTVNKTWISQVHDSGGGYTQHILTINNNDNSVSVVQVGTVVSQDDHNDASILIRASDNRLFICYAEHQTSTNLRYRLSTNALDASSWGNESVYTTASAVTYPSCFQASNGNIFIFYREVTACACYIKSTDGGVTFGGRTNYFAGIGSRGYVLHAQSPLNPDIIHFIISTEHPYAGTNVSCYAFYFDCSTEKFYKLDGTEITANIPFDATSDMTEVFAVTDPNVTWIEDIIVDSTGKPRYLMTYYPNGKGTSYLTKDLYYAEWNGSAITTPYKIHTAVARQIGGTETTYPPVACFDVNDPDKIIAPKDISGVLELFKITRNTYNDFTSLQITSNSIYDQWRPVTVKSATNNVFYLRTKKYGVYTDFIQALDVNAI